MTKKELFSKLAVPNVKDNILLLTHTDLDGAGAAILMRTFFPNVSVKHCSVTTMRADILDACFKGCYDFIVVCDISCSLADAESISSIPDIANHFVLIDHHPSAEQLNKYPFAVVYPEMVTDSFRIDEYPDSSKERSSGTALLYDYLVYNGFVSNTNQHIDMKMVEKFVSLVSKYDTWDWMEVFKGEDSTPRTLSSLCFLYGIDIFEDRMVHKMLYANKEPFFDSTDELLLTIEASKVKEHLEGIRKSYQPGYMRLQDREYSLVYCACNSYLPQTFEDMQTCYPLADLCIINCGNRMSIRSRNPDVNVAELTKAYGGGGHPGAGGFNIPFALQMGYFEAIMNAEFDAFPHNTSRFSKQ